MQEYNVVNDIVEDKSIQGRILFLEKLSKNKVVQSQQGFKIKGNKLIKYTSTENTENIVLPEGVEEIGERAFSGSNIRSIKLPKSLVSIGIEAFANCIQLKEIHIQNKTMSIGERAFIGCEKLKIVDMFNSVTFLGDGCFQDCVNLQEIHLSNLLEALNSNLFNRCLSLKEIDIPKGIKQIRPNVFKDCENLEHIIISESIENVSKGAFIGCKNLKEIEISKKNKKYTAEDLIIYNKDKTILKYYHPYKKNKELVVVQGVTQIEMDALINSIYLEYVELPTSVKYVCTFAFRGCINLKEVKILNKQCVLGGYVFEKNTQVKYV